MTAFELSIVVADATEGGDAEATLRSVATATAGLRIEVLLVGSGHAPINSAVRSGSPILRAGLHNKGLRICSP